MPSGTTGVRVVAFDDLDARAAYALWRLRQQVFVVEQASPYPDLDGRDLDSSTRHVLAEEDGVLVGCLRVLGAVPGAETGARADGLGSVVRIGRVAVVPSARGRGLAAAMMAAALELAGDREVRLDAQTGLREWYAGYGFEVSGPEFVEDGVPHVPMVRPG
jgi:ElaA protein